MNTLVRQRETLLLIFAVTGGAWAWTLQLWLSWMLGEPLCFAGPGEFSLAGLGSGALWVIVGVASAGFAAAALAASFGVWRGSRAGNEEVAPPSRPRRFLAYVGLVLNVLFLLTILLGTTSPLFLQACT